MRRPPRPTGVTILAVLSILGGIAFLVIGAGLVVVGLVIGTYVGTQLSNQLASSGYSGLSSLSAGSIAAILTAIGAIVLILGILYLAVAIGFLGGKGWAWTLAIIGYIIGIIINVVQIALGAVTSVVGLIIGIIILYYLTRPHVKSFFGKGPAMGSGMMPGQPMGSYPTGAMGPMGTTPPPTMGQMGMTCKNCGGAIPAGATRCPNCGASV
jgi:hypothetical protein